VAEDDHDKTLEATPYRRQQARQKGHIARSLDLGSAVTLLAGIVLLSWFGKSLAEFFETLATDQLAGDAWLRADAEFVTDVWARLAMSLAGVLLPLLGLLLAAAVVVNLAQTGLIAMPQKVLPDASRIDPLAGFARVFSGASAMRLGFGVLKIAVVAGVLWLVAESEASKLASLGSLSTPQLAGYFCDLLFWTAFKLAGTLVALGAVDYAYQRWTYEQRLRMTPQEMREELKQAEGDPQIAARRKKLAREAASNPLPLRANRCPQSSRGDVA
jgi:flagellar biosynthetic protein FlhB